MKHIVPRESIVQTASFTRQMLVLLFELSLAKEVKSSYAVSIAAASFIRPTSSGTTGWTDRLGELQELCRERGGALFYASNYCLGVNLMFRLNRQLAAMIDRVGGYDVRIEEVHHTQKKDAPSGTAITLAEGIVENLAGKQGWVNLAPGIEHAANRIERSGEAPADRIEIRSVREGAVPGIHTVTYESEDDVLEIRHTIKNRRTLALGAVVAAEFLCGKQGVYSMDDLLRNA